MVGSAAIAKQDPGGNTAAPQLAQALGAKYLGGSNGGAVLLAVIAAVAFATILAVVAGLTLRLVVQRGARPVRQRDPRAARPTSGRR